MRNAGQVGHLLAQPGPWGVGSGMEHPIIVLTGPSGAGKTSIAQRLLEADPQLVFSISATTRRPRDYEVDGKDYYFFSEEDFRGLIQGGKLLEYEEVYPGTFYGTLRSELDRLTPDQRMLLDIDIKGALQLRKLGLKNSLFLFISPPNQAVLEERLRGRGTESEATLQTRLARATEELSHRDRFDAIVYNRDLDSAVQGTLEILTTFYANVG